MSQLIQSGGVQVVTQLNQIVYLDFDGEYTSYNGEILNVDGVVVEDSKLSGERIAEIVAALNEKYAPAGVKFVTERPVNGEYSTVYVGKTDDFDQYGNFAGLAETIDKGNTNKSDNAFVMLDSTASNAQIVDTISHETDHLLGTLDHGGDGLDAYAAYYYYNQTYTGVLKGYLELWHNSVKDSSSIYDGDNTSYYYYDKAQNVTVTTSNGQMTISTGGVASNTTLLSAYNSDAWAGGMYICSGGVAYNTAVSHSYMTILSGGVANNTTINDTTPFDLGMHINFGGTANSTIINSGGKMYISSGGVANDVTLYAGGFIWIFGVLKNFHYSGGQIANGISMSFGANSVFFGGTRANCGGAIYNGGSMTIGDGAIFSGNVANNHGGAIYNSNGSMTIGDNAMFSGNVASSGRIYNDLYHYYGGAIHNYYGGSMTIGDGAVFSGNVADYYGGAIFNHDSMTIGDGAVFTENMANRYYGGAIHNHYGDSMTIGDGAVFSGNVANYGGGAIYNSNGSMTIGDGAVFSGNVASSGGAIYNSGYWSIFYNSTTSSYDSKYCGQITFGDVTFATYTDTIYNRGAIILNGDASFAGNITLVNSSDTIFQNNGNIDFNVAARLEDDGLLLNNWELVSGDGTYSVTVDNKQAAGTYQLIGNAANFDKTITVRSESGSKMGELSLDMEEPLELRNMSLMLDYDEETNIISLIVDSEYSEGTDRERQETKLELPTNAFAGMSYGDYTLTQAPDWLSIDPTTGKFSGTTGKITGTSTGYGTTEIIVTGTRDGETKEHIIEAVVVPETIKGDGAIKNTVGGTMTDLIAEAVSKRNEHPVAGSIEIKQEKEINWEYCGLDLEVTDMSVSLEVTDTDYELKLQGKLGLSIFDSGKSADERASLTVDLSENNYIKITTPHDFGGVEFDIVGEMTFKNLTLADGFFLKEGVITVDTEEDVWSGTADIEFTHFDKALHAEYIVIDKQVDTLTVELSGLNIAVGTTGFFLNSVNGGVRNLSDSDDKPSELVGGVVLSYGKKVNIGGNSYTLATLDLEAIVTNSSLTGNGEFEILEGVLTGDVSATVNWKQGSLSASGSLTFANLATVQGAFEVDMSGNISVSASGIVDFSEYGLNAQASSNLYLQYVNDGVSSNDFYAAWSTVSLFGIEQSLGVRLNLDGSWKLLGSNDVSGFSIAEEAASGDGMICREESTASQSWDLTGVSGVVLLTAKWDSGTAEVTLSDGTGKTYTLTDIRSRSDMEIVEELGGDKTLVIALKDSVSGVWSMNVGNVENAEVSAVTIGSESSVSAPELKATLGTDRTVTINWSCGTVPEDSTLCIYYDMDGTGYNGILVSSIEPESASGTVEWVVPDAVGGNLRFYAVLTSPETVPAMGAYTGAVSIAEKKQRLSVNYSGWTYVGNGYYTESATVSSGAVVEVDGGSVSGMTKIKSGGEMILSNAELSGMIDLSGSLELKGSNTAADAEINLNLSGKEIESSYMVDGISKLSGADWTITVSAVQELGTYYLANGAEGFNRTITLKVGDESAGMLTVNGDKLKIDGISYTLTETDGNLCLTVESGPSLTITGNATSWTNKNVVLTASTDETGMIIEYSVNNKDWIKGTTAVVDGNRTIYWRVVDTNGNVLTTESIVVDKIDKTAPTVTVKKNSAGSNIVLSATANESGSTIEYSVNKKTWIKGSSAVVDGNRTVYWRATDAVGNVSEIVSYQVNDFVTVSSAKVSNGLKVSAGKIMKVLFGGTANQTIVSSGGVMNVAGKANYTSAFKGAAVNISKGGSMFGVNLYSGAELNISSGGTVNALTFNGKGTAYVYSGGQLTSTTVNSSGTLAVYNGAKVTSATLKNGGTMNYYGGTVYNVELLYGGSMTIESSAVRKGQIANKGTIIVSSGGKASGCIMKDGGAMKVLSGGSADDTKLMTNGIIYVYSSGNVTDTVTSYGARVYVSGGKIYNTNMQRGTITSVYQGGMASLNKVDYGSYLMVGSGATSYDTVVSSGGGLTVMAGAKAGKNTVYGTLTCNNGGTLLGVTVIHGRANLAGNAVVTDETSITFDVSERSASAMQESYREAMLNSYYVAREADMTISVAADQASGSYILANWALEAKKGTFTLEVDGTEVGTFSTTKSLTYNGKTYSLYCFDDATNSKALTLKVSNATARDAWTELGTGDFDGDGIEESLVSDGTNLYAASEDLWLGNLSATEEIASITDYNNDGTDDILIHNTATDQMTAWLVKDGTTYSTLAIA